MIKHRPMRMCIACRKMKDQKELLRVVREVETNKIIIDIHKKSFGRGAYVCADEKCIKLAMKKKGFERHLRCEAVEGLYEELLNMEESAR